MEHKPEINEAEREELVAYLDGEVDERAATEVEAKLAGSETLRREAGAMKAAYDLLDFLPMPATTPDFTRRTLVFVEQPLLPEQPVRPSKLRGWIPVASGTLFLAGIVLAFFAGWRLTAAVDDPQRQLLEDLPIIERFEEYRVARDLELLHALRDQHVLDQLDQALEVPEPSEAR